MDLASIRCRRIQDELIGGGWFGFIHCAGISRGGRLDTLSVEDWNLSLDVNVTSAMKICQLADSHMMDGGRILLVGSPVGIAGANKPSYAASKSCPSWLDDVRFTPIRKTWCLCQHSTSRTYDNWNDW